MRSNQEASQPAYIIVTYQDNCVVKQQFYCECYISVLRTVNASDSSETLSETVSNGIVKIEYITTVYARHCHCHLLG